MRITLIGSGNVATHLGAALRNAAHHIVQVYSRHAQNAALLAYHVRAEPISDLSQISAETDLFIISINDDAIGAMAEQLAVHRKLMVHTSGATPLTHLLAFTDLAGVFYPLQTFSKSKEVDFRSVPLCIEGADEQIVKDLRELAQTISNNVALVSSEQRKVLHLSAVFSCNFPNYLYYTAQQLLAQHQLDFNLLRPLIAETAQKVQERFPADVQTGPAIRHDEKTMLSHMAMLQPDEDLRRLYGLLSQAIIKMGKDKQGVK